MEEVFVGTGRHDTDVRRDEHDCRVLNDERTTKRIDSTKGC